MIYWMTGLSGSGKTTIAIGIEKLCPVEVLEGDTLRKGLCGGLGYSSQDRTENLRRIAHLAAHLNKYTDVIVACITPYESTREMVQSICGEVRTIFVKASLQECIRRDPKRLYARAQRGEITNMTGLDDLFEPPSNPDLVIDTESQTPIESIRCLFQYMCNASRRYSIFIGRWQPFHIGHEFIIRKKLEAGKNVAIAVRDTPLGPDDPFPLKVRMDVIKAVFRNEIEVGRIIVFPIVDLESINIGRNVGYGINEIAVPKEILSISATEIRKMMLSGEKWTQFVPLGAVGVLQELKGFLQ